MDTRPILLVEDNPDDIELMLRAIKKNNIANEVKVTKSGEEAADYLFVSDSESDKRKVLPAVILLDLKLPQMDGFELLGKIRAHALTKLIPVVILTSSKEQLDLLRGYSLGANSYVRKPVNYEQFVSAVQQLGMYWLKLNEPIPYKGGM